MTATLTFSEVVCRHPNCGGELEQVNAGTTDGAVANWVGRCERCARQWCISASMTQVNSRGSGAH